MSEEHSDHHTHNDYLSRGCHCRPDASEAESKAFRSSCAKLQASDWLAGVPLPPAWPKTGLAEVRFKNSRKEFFRVPEGLVLEAGDIVAVESSPGHDIGIVSLYGETVRLQLKNRRINPNTADFKRIYRKAKVSDIEKWAEAISQEADTMLRSRAMASRLRLQMKISDVEYQGDRTKAIFYYTADDRVDFRELIRVLADAFHVRIEMRQIGMRQEASRLGGIGSCGRELCCATWLTHFRTVSTNAARNQQLSLNPQKLAGQCSKLKCCINYENDCYTDALNSMPDTGIELETQRGRAFFQKADPLRGLMGYAYKDKPSQIEMISFERVKQIMQMNRKKIFPEDLPDTENMPVADEGTKNELENSLEDSLTRFDSPERNKAAKKKKKRKKTRGPRPQNFSNEND